MYHPVPTVINRFEEYLEPSSGAFYVVEGFADSFENLNGTVQIVPLIIIRRRTHLHSHVMPVENFRKTFVFNTAR